MAASVTIVICIMSCCQLLGSQRDAQENCVCSIIKTLSASHYKSTLYQATKINNYVNFVQLGELDLLRSKYKIKKNKNDFV